MRLLTHWLIVASTLPHVVEPLDSSVTCEELMSSLTCFAESVRFALETSVRAALGTAHSSANFAATLSV